MGKRKGKVKGYLGIPEVGGEVVTALAELEGDDLVHDVRAGAISRFSKSSVLPAQSFTSWTSQVECYLASTRACK